MSRVYRDADDRESGALFSRMRRAQAARCFASARQMRCNGFQPEFFLFFNQRKLARNNAAHARFLARSAGKEMPRSVVHNGGKRRKA